MRAVLKSDGDEVPHCVYNELVASRLARLVLAPLADGVLAEQQPQRAFASLVLAAPEGSLADLSPTRVVLASDVYPGEAAALTVFDIWIGNWDRAGNLKASLVMRHRRLFCGFDHSHSLLAVADTPADSIHRLGDGELIVKRHPFYGQLRGTLLDEWTERVASLPEALVRAACELGEPLNDVEEDTQTALAEAMAARTRALPEMIHAVRDRVVRVFLRAKPAARELRRPVPSPAASVSAAVVLLAYSPDPEVPTKPVAVAVFHPNGAPLLKTLAQAGGEALDCVPFASLFPKHAHLAWAFAEWMDWLQASLVEAGIPLSELQAQLARPTMAAMTIVSQKTRTGDPAKLLESEFKHRVTWPAELPPGALAELFEELAFAQVARIAEEGGRRFLITQERTRGERLFQGRLRGLVIVKSARPEVSPAHRAASIRRVIPKDNGSERVIVVTNRLAVAERLRALGVDAIALGEEGYLLHLAAWFAALA